MAKKKLNLCGLILKIVAIFTGLMTFVSMAFKFAKADVSVAGKVVGSNTQSLKDWFDSIKTYGKINADGISCWKVSRVFMIITLVLIAIVVALVIVKFFVSNKYVDLVLLIVSSLAIITTLVMLITLLVGMNQFVKFINDMNKLQTTKMYPYAGSICMVIFSALTGITGILMSTLKKAK